MSNQRLDALTPGEGVAFARDVEHIHATVLETKRPPKSFFNLFPIGTSVDSAAKTHIQKMIESTGRAKISTGHATDIPSVSVGITEESRNIRYILSKYGWTIFEIRTALKAGVSLGTQFAMAARDIIEQEHNDIFWDGDEDNGLRGLFTHPEIPRVTQSEPISSSASSVAALIADLKAFLRTSFVLTKTIMNPTTLLVPPTQFGYLADTNRSTTSDQTILDSLKASAATSGGSLNVIPVHELEDAGGSGVDLIVAYTADPVVARGEIPGGEVFRSLAPQAVDLSMNVPCWGTNGGFVCDYPLQMAVGVLP